MKPRNPLVVMGRQRKANVIKDKRTEEKLHNLDLELEDCCELCTFYNMDKRFCNYHKKFVQRNFICKNYLSIEEEFYWNG